MNSRSVLLTMHHWLVMVAASGLLIAATGCSDIDDRPSGDSHAATVVEPPTNRIAIPATVRNNLGITFAAAERRAVADTIRVPGAFELQPRARQVYQMTLPGTVELLVDQFDEVEQGEVLYRFRSPQWPELKHEVLAAEQAMASATAEIAVAQARVTEAKSNLAQVRERLEQLESAGVRQATLEMEAREIEARLPRLEAEVGLAEAKLGNAEGDLEHALHRASTVTGIDEETLGEPVTDEEGTRKRYQTIHWIDVRANRDGVVDEVHVTDGGFVEPPSVVLRMIDPTMLRFVGMGLQSDLPRLSSDSPTWIVPPRSKGVGMNDSVEAQLSIAVSAHADDRTVPLHVTPGELRSWMRPGVAAFLEVAVDSTGGMAVAIPRSAIVRDGITHVFFLRDPADPNQVIRVEADMGVNDGRWVALNSGVAIGDEVVVDGAYELKLASEQSGVSQKGGHFHADGTFHEAH